MQSEHSRFVIVAGFLAILATMVIVGISGLVQLDRLHQQQQWLDEQLIIKRDLLTSMLTASRERALALNLITNLNDPFRRDEEIMRYHELAGQFAAAREALLAMDLVDEERRYLAQQGQAVAEGLESQLQVIALVEAGRRDEARQLLTTQALPTQQRVFALLQQLYDEQSHLHLQRAAQEGSSSHNALLKMMLWLMAAAVGIGGATALVVIRQIGRSEEALLRANERFDLAMRGANDGLWDRDLQHNHVYYSPRWKEMLGYRDGELGSVPAVWRELIHPDDRAEAETKIAAHLSGDSPLYEHIHRMRHRDGQYRWHLERGIAVQDTQGVVQRMVGTSTDITRLKETEEALFAEKERALVTLHSIGDAVITTDHHGNVTYLNPIAERLTGWSNSEAHGASLEHVCPLFDDERKESIPSPVHVALAKGDIHTLRCTTVVEDRHHARHAITASAAPIRDSSGGYIGAIMVLRDVSESRELARRLSWQASHDALTGLYNRQEMEERLNSMLESAQRDHAQHAFLYLDLDQFKLVNDTSGHLAGDELLRQLSYLLKQALRDNDTLARLGGDEFGVLLSYCPLEKATEIAAHLRSIVHEFRFVWQEKSFDIGVSIGIVPIDQRSGSSAAILSAADLACYAAKDLGRNRIHLYVPEDEELSRRHGEMEWVSRVRDALVEDRFVLYAQEIRAAAGAREGEGHVELLVRMVDEAGGLILPGQFIPAAERYNLMPLIDRKVVELALMEMAVGGGTPQLVAINLSGASLGDGEFLDYVRSLFKRSGVAPQRICFEVTETAAITNLAHAMRFMGELKQMGCRFSLDDFGSGLSSFSYLKNLPVDYLKIDGCFIRDVAEDPYDRAMVEAICRIGRVMGLKTIAEFVENEAIFNELQEIGIDYVQGYWVGMPYLFSRQSSAARRQVGSTVESSCSADR